MLLGLLLDVYGYNVNCFPRLNVMAFEYEI